MARKKKRRRRCAVCETLTHNKKACSKRCGQILWQRGSVASQAVNGRARFEPELHERFFSFMAKEPPPLPLVKDFDFGDECWPWYGAIDSWGYALFWLGKKGVQAGRTTKLISASKYSWEYFNGAIPERDDGDENLIFIDCENKTCSNPRHLKMGTRTEVLGPRQKLLRKSARWGDNNASSKLSDADVVTIKQLHKERRFDDIGTLAKLRGVTREHAIAVGRSTGRNRKHRTKTKIVEGRPYVYQ